MNQIYAIYDPETDRVVGIHGTYKTIHDDQHKMLATVNQPGEFWHKEAQAHPDSWRVPADLKFVLLDTFIQKGDRNRLVKEWRSSRFSEARSIAKKQTGRATPEACVETECLDRPGPPFWERLEQWVDLTTSLFGGDTHEWTNNSNDADRKRARRLLGKKIGCWMSCELAKGFYNALNNYDKFSEMGFDEEQGTPVDTTGIPF